MLAAQPDKSIMNVYNFQKVCSPLLLTHRLLELSDSAGSTRSEDCAPRKTLMYRCRPKRRPVRCRYFARTAIHLGGTCHPFFCTQHKNNA